MQALSSSFAKTFWRENATIMAGLAQFPLSRRSVAFVKIVGPATAPK
jgi:hypothetical protein